MSSAHSANMESNTKEESSDNDSIEEYDLEQDTFSFLFVANVFSLSFVVAVTIYAMEVVILILFIINELKENNATDINPLGVPVWIDREVRAGQFIAILVTVLTSSDLVTSLDVFYVPYDDIVEKAFPDATRYRWYISNFCRLTADLLIVAISFVIIVQSSSNLALFENFAAISFVSSLDDATFALISSGFGSRDSTALATKMIENLKFKFKSKDKKNERYVKNGCLFTIFLILVAGYAGVFFYQVNGYYFKNHCQIIEVKLADKKYDFFRSNFNEVCEESAFDKTNAVCPANWQARSDEDSDSAKYLKYLSFNGVYDMQKSDVEGPDYKLYNHRPIYIQRGKKGFDAFGKDSPPGRFMYCDGSWVFSIPGVHKGKIDYSKNNAGNDAEDNCHWLLKSPKTKAYELSEVSLSNWVVWTGRLQVVKDLSIHCIECERESSELVASCSYNGICNEEKRCECEDDYMGVQCETCICDTLYTTWEGSEWTYHRVDDNGGLPLTVYGRPVYLLKEIDSKPVSENSYLVERYGANVSQLLMYTGYDYVFINLNFDSNEEMINYLRLFHSGWDYDYVNKTSSLSERTDEPMPSGLEWFYLNKNGTTTKAFFSMSCKSGACYGSSNSE